MLRDVFLIAQPPLLGEEGKIRDTTIWATAPSVRVLPRLVDTGFRKRTRERGLKPATTLLIRMLTEIHEKYGLKPRPRGRAIFLRPSGPHSLERADSSFN